MEKKNKIKQKQDQMADCYSSEEELCLSGWARTKYLHERLVRLWKEKIANGFVQKRPMSPDASVFKSAKEKKAFRKRLKKVWDKRQSKRLFFFFFFSFSFFFFFQKNYFVKLTHNLKGRF